MLKHSWQYPNHTTPATCAELIPSKTRVYEVESTPGVTVDPMLLFVRVEDKAVDPYCMGENGKNYCSGDFCGLGFYGCCSECEVQSDGGCSKYDSCDGCDNCEPTGAQKFTSPLVCAIDAMTGRTMWHAAVHVGDENNILLAPPTAFLRDNICYIRFVTAAGLQDIRCDGQGGLSAEQTIDGNNIKPSSLSPSPSPSPSQSPSPSP